jgi:hypothetical protein
MEHQNLIAGPPATYLPEDVEATAELAAGDDPSAVAARYPTFLAAWAALADRAMEQGDAVTSYAFARTGYHRGLDQLRRSRGSTSPTRVSCGPCTRSAGPPTPSGKTTRPCAAAPS